ncbi:MAG: hypothetical protein Harvfovirus71_8 [Harvfovirus sp.]|uniref:Uncharacterized protein n=1 Tax=Harvfovirus sp. TaxID=2487768 RepID=A0A3G5A7R7_9VIRU|nr:MAG: hypothetical protein Harvfovirus71_8 [Harvfovirus sp.]
MLIHVPRCHMSFRSLSEIEPLFTQDLKKENPHVHQKKEAGSGSH